MSSGFAPTFSFGFRVMEKDLVSSRVENIATKVAATCGVELVHVEIAGTKRDCVVRIFIDKPDGLTLDDCASYSRDVETILEGEDFIPSRYVLEVSSPGIERELYSLDDFKKFAGRLAKVKTKIEIDGQKTFAGIIVEATDEKIEIDDRTKGTVSFKFADVAKANLKIDLSKEFKSR